jgi:hypothetical protein
MYGSVVKTSNDLFKGPMFSTLSDTLNIIKVPSTSLVLEEDCCENGLFPFSLWAATIVEAQPS